MIKKIKDFLYKIAYELNMNIVFNIYTIFMIFLFILILILLKICSN